MVAPGINGKMSEFNAAFGILQLQYMEKALARRKEIAATYRELFKHVKGVHCIQGEGETVANYSYFPILVDADYPISRDGLYQKLKDQGIFARRYFYPLISDFPMYRGLPSASRDNLPVATDAALKVLCLPNFTDLSTEAVELIVQVIAGKVT